MLLLPCIPRVVLSRAFAPSVPEGYRPKGFALLLSRPRTCQVDRPVRSAVLADGNPLTGLLGIKALLVVYVLPWMLPAVQACISFRWMLAGEEALIDRALAVLIGVDGPIWFNHWWLALGANIVAYVWKWMPFWTVIFLAGRMAIPRDVSDAAAVDGAAGSRRFVHVTFPLLANLYLVCTLLSTMWTMGEFTTVYFVSGGAPVWSTEVLATLAFHYAFDAANPALGVAAVMSVLPLLVPVVIVLMRALQTRAVQL